MKALPTSFIVDYNKHITTKYEISSRLRIQLTHQGYVGIPVQKPHALEEPIKVLKCLKMLDRDAPRRILRGPIVTNGASLYSLSMQSYNNSRKLQIKFTSPSSDKQRNTEER